MKINSKINKRVNESVAECRKVITEATIDLLKKIAKPGQVVFFDNTLFLYQTKANVSETILVNNIAYAYGRKDSSFYIVSMGDDRRFCKSDYMLSLSNLLVIFDAVKAVVRSE